jgi:hypothetical protein
MGKIVGAELPFFLPAPHFFLRMAVTDIFVIADSLSFSPRSAVQRTSVIHQGKKLRLTVPVHGHYTVPVNEIRIDHHGRWQKEMLKNIRRIFRLSPYFDEFYPALEMILLKEQDYLWELNLELILWFIRIWKISPRIMLLSDLFSAFPLEDPVWAICRKLSASHYVIDDNNRKFVNPEKLKKGGVEVLDWEDYGKFIPSELSVHDDCSALEMLFEQGPMAEILFKNVRDRYAAKI